MLEKFSPNLYVKSIYHIDLDKLWNRGIRAIITDLDNTLVAWDSPLPDQRLMEWLGMVQAKGFAVFIVSNNSRDRVDKFAKAVGIPAISKAIKPRRGAFRTALETLGVSATETAVVGDQIFTDVLGGNRHGLFTILVLPVSDKEFFGTKINRALEQMVLRRLKRRGLTDSPDD
ncbi:MAG: YqeG family HAD IIIA-type phosphatase [Firmicutes bacterium]|nr:YqeG family HAD IIIA-type phosphatase [Bacillota bacterium]